MVLFEGGKDLEKKSTLCALKSTLYALRNSKKSNLLRTETRKKEYPLTHLNPKQKWSGLLSRGRCVSRHIAFRYKRTHTHITRAHLCGSFSREREKGESGGEQQNGVRVASFFRRRRRKKKHIIFIACSARGTIARETRTRSYDRIGSEILGEDQNDRKEEIRRDRSGWRDVRRRLVGGVFVFFSREITSSARR